MPAIACVEDRRTLSPAVAAVSGRVRGATLAFAALLSLPFGVRDAQAQENTIEAAIKATYLYKIPAFIEWPAGILSRIGQFTICIIGNDPFGGTLDRAIVGQRVGNLPIAVRRLSAFSADAACQVVYAAGSAAQSVAGVLATVHGSPVLSVTDGAHDPQAKGIVNFAIVDNRVRFEIDDELAADSKLIVSSKLLNLATNVRLRSQ